jgi:hypothetical protein
MLDAHGSPNGGLAARPRPPGTVNLTTVLRFRHREPAVREGRGPDAARSPPLTDPVGGVHEVSFSIIFHLFLSSGPLGVPGGPRGPISDGLGLVSVDFGTLFARFGDNFR